MAYNLNPFTGSLDFYKETSETISFNDLSDVTITSAAAGDILRYDGSAWINTKTLTHAITVSTNVKFQFVSSSYYIKYDTDDPFGLGTALRLNVASSNSFYISDSIGPIAYFNSEGSRFYFGGSTQVLNFTSSIESVTHRPFTTATYDLGSSSLVWRAVYSNTISLYASSNQIVMNAGGFTTTLSSSGLLSNITVTFPSITGTLATLASLTQVFDSAGTVYTQFGATALNQTPVAGNDQVLITKTTTATSGTYRALIAEGSFSGSSASSAAIQGFNAFVYSSGSGNLTLSTNGGGMRNRFVIQHGGSGTVTLANAMSTRITGTGSAVGTITDAFGYHFEGGVPNASQTFTRSGGLWIRDGSGSGTIGTYYGIRIDALTKGSVNMAMAIESTGKIYFNSTTVVSGEYIYSSAADTLDVNANATFNMRIGTTVVMSVDANSVDIVQDVNVTSGKKIYLEGAGSDSYIWYNSGSSQVEIYVNGTKAVGFA